MSPHGQGLAQPPAPAWAGRRAIVSERSGLCASRDAVNVVRPGFLSGWEPHGPQTHFSDPEPTRFHSTPGCRGFPSHHLVWFFASGPPGELLPCL